MSATGLPTERPAPDPFSGTGYRLIEPLGAGGMGQVFLVERQGLGRRLVAKVLHQRMAGDPGLADRMRLEAQALGRLRHPHIVSVVGFGTVSDGRPFFVMELLQGESLDDALARRELPLPEALTYTMQILSALSEAHGYGIVHRDIKPENVFLCDSPSGQAFVKLLDFGVARILPDAKPGAPAPPIVPTDTGMVVGTPRWVSPEVALGGRADARSDIYSVGLVLYRLIAGRTPFVHESDAAQLVAHASEVPQAPSSFAQPSFAQHPLVPELDALILKALHKDPDQRFQTADEFRQTLVHVLERLGHGARAREATQHLAAVTSQDPPEPAPGTPRVAIHGTPGAAPPEVAQPQPNQQSPQPPSPDRAGLATAHAHPAAAHAHPAATYAPRSNWISLGVMLVTMTVTLVAILYLCLLWLGVS